MPYSRSIALAFVALATACASQMPTEQLAVANSAIDRAERAGAAEYAAADLATARDKLQRASNGANSHSMPAAQVSYLAQEAEADAKLAEAETQSGKAKAAVAATQEDLQAIQEEAQRSADAAAVPQTAPQTAPLTAPRPAP
jgi:Domain of unknown function (DUF4398)